MDVNASGQVVGTSTTAAGVKHAFLWQAGTMLDLGTLGGASSAAVAIDDSGRVAGDGDTAAGERHAFLWASGAIRDLGALPVTMPELATPAANAVALNQLGEITGLSVVGPHSVHVIRTSSAGLVDSLGAGP